MNSATLPARPWAGAVSPDAPARRRHPRGHHRLSPTASRRFRAKGARVRAPGNRKGRKTRPSLRARKRARHAGRGGQAAGEGPLRAGRCGPCRHHPNRSGRFRGGGDWHSKQRRREGGGCVSCFFCVCSGVLRCAQVSHVLENNFAQQEEDTETPRHAGRPWLPAWGVGGWGAAGRVRGSGFAELTRGRRGSWPQVQPNLSITPASHAVIGSCCHSADMTVASAFHPQNLVLLLEAKTQLVFPQH